MNIMEKASELIKGRVPFAFVTVVASKGSTPRSAASKMLVLSDGTTFDTIGGGLVEARAIEEAVRAIAEGKPGMLKYRLNSSADGGLNMLCGGDMDIFIDVYNKKPHVIIVGGGHVGYAVAKGVKLLDWDYSVIEERGDFNSDQRFTDARHIYREGDLEEASGLECDENTFIVIVTKGHDGEVLRRVAHMNAGYIGMIGSKRKVEMVIRDLVKDGISEQALQRVYTPIGLDINAETPEEIAFSIIAEMIKFRNGGSGNSMSGLR